MFGLKSNFSRKNLQKSFYGFLLFSLIVHLISISREFDFQNSSDKKSPYIAQQIPAPIRLKLLEEKKKQIVETNQTENDENLEKIKDRFLSNKDNFFKKETVTANVGKFQNATNTSEGQNGEKNIEKLKKLSIKDFSLGDLSKFKVSAPEEAKKKGDSKSNNSNLNPSIVSQTNDFIDDVEIGELTQLNTSEFKFYGFYYRIKQRLEQHWGNSLREKAKRLSRRNISSNGNKITALVVILDSFGRIINVHLKSTSGVEELDSAAIESFNKAGPFPNPPKEMLEDGKAKIEWGFVVKT